MQYRIDNSLWLTVTAFVLAVGVAVPVGIYSALPQYSFLDYAATTFTFFGVSIPVFWFGIMAIYLFAVWHPWTQIPGLAWVLLPPGGISTPRVGEGLPFLLDRLRYMNLPSLFLALLCMAGNTPSTRSTMLDAVQPDYVLTAPSHGHA